MGSIAHTSTIICKYLIPVFPKLDYSHLSKIKNIHNAPPFWRPLWQIFALCFFPTNVSPAKNNMCVTCASSFSGLPEKYGSRLPGKSHCQWLHWERHLWTKRRDGREEFGLQQIVDNRHSMVEYGDRAPVWQRFHVKLARACAHALISLTCFTVRHISCVLLTLLLSGCIDTTYLALRPHSPATHKHEGRQRILLRVETRGSTCCCRGRRWSSNKMFISYLISFW